MRDFRKLRVWQSSHALTIAIYRATAGFPKDETYGLRSQIRRAASSIGANLAEASGRQHDPDQVRLCRIAMGSACELENHLLLAQDLKFIDQATCERLISSLEGVKRMLTVFIQSLTAEGRRPTAPL